MIRDFKFLDLKAITILPISHFKFEELMQYYCEEFNNWSYSYGVMTIENKGLFNIDKEFKINQIWTIKSKHWNIADSLYDIYQNQTKVEVRFTSKQSIAEKLINEAYEVSTRFNINSLKLVDSPDFLVNK